MDKIKSKFEIKPTIEQKPFENPAIQAFFGKWCEINDSIEPQVISRDDWERKYKKIILEKRSDGKQNLYIPEDLRLWEIVGVMEAVDHDTFAAKPERQNEAKKKLMELGKMFQDAGVYIAQRLDSITKGREVAGALAEEFYGYGQSLMMREKSEEPQGIDNIASLPLTEQEITTIDRFLAGDNLYESRRERVENKIKAGPDKKDELYETERQKTLTQFFRVAAKAFELKRKSESGKLRENKVHLKPWQNDAPLHSAFIAKVEKAMTQKVETPKRELGGLIFRKGMELLQKNMPFDKLPDFIKNYFLHWKGGEKTLREALWIDRLKIELEAVRQSGDMAEISAKERKIADKIQTAVSYFSYKSGANNPSEMVANQYINCVGASTLGGALMREAGLNYLLGDLPGHSILFLITNDGHVEWRDMLNCGFNKDLTDEIILGSKKNGLPLTVADIVAFSKKPTPQGLMFDLNRNKITWGKGGQGRHVTVFEPEYGQQIQILNNMGNTLYNLGRYNEAVEAFRLSIAVNPKYAYPYCGLAVTLNSLGRYKEAVEAFRLSVAINPKYAHPYYGLGNALDSLGRYNEAVEAYQKFIDLADKREDDKWIKRAENKIAKLKENK